MRVDIEGYNTFVDFPDDTDEQTILSVLQKNFPDPAKIANPDGSWKVDTSALPTQPVNPYKPQKTLAEVYGGITPTDSNDSNFSPLPDYYNQEQETPDLKPENPINLMADWGKTLVASAPKTASGVGGALRAVSENVLMPEVTKRNIDWEIRRHNILLGEQDPGQQLTPDEIEEMYPSLLKKSKRGKVYVGGVYVPDDMQEKWQEATKSAEKINQLNEELKNKYSVAKEAPATQIGTDTYRYWDKVSKNIAPENMNEGRSEMATGFVNSADSIGRLIKYAPIMTTAPYLIPTLLGAEAGAEKYGELREKGVDAPTAGTAAALTMASETGTEHLPVTYIFKGLQEGKRFGVNLLKSGVTDVIGELASTKIDHEIERQILNNHISDEQAQKDYRETAWTSAFMTVIMGPLGAGYKKILQKNQQDNLATYLKNVADKAEQKQSKDLKDIYVEPTPQPQEQPQVEQDNQQEVSNNGRKEVSKVRTDKVPVQGQEVTEEAPQAEVIPFDSKLPIQDSFDGIIAKRDGQRYLRVEKDEGGNYIAKGWYADTGTGNDTFIDFTPQKSEVIDNGKTKGQEEEGRQGLLATDVPMAQTVVQPSKQQAAELTTSTTVAPENTTAIKADQTATPKETPPETVSQETTGTVTEQSAAVPVSKQAEDSLIKTLPHKTKGLETRVYKLNNGKYSVVLYDTDINNALPTIKIHDTQEAAIKNAEEISAPKVEPKQEAATNKSIGMFDLLPKKTQDIFNTAWDNKDIKKFQEILHKENKTLRQEFQKRSGIKLPNTVKGTDEAINKYFNIVTAFDEFADKKGVEETTETPKDNTVLKIGDTFSHEGRNFRIEEIRENGNVQALDLTGPYPISRIYTNFEKETGLKIDRPELKKTEQLTPEPEKEKPKIIITKEEFINKIKSKKPIDKIAESDTIKVGGQTNDAAKLGGEKIQDDRNSNEGESSETVSIAERTGETGPIREGIGRRNDADSERPGSISTHGDRQNGQGLLEQSEKDESGRVSDTRRSNEDIPGVPGERGADHRIAEGELSREGSWKTTASRNLDIVDLIHKLDAENRQATPEEKALLVQYTGWGSSEIRNGLFSTYSNYGKLIPEYAKPEYKELVKRANEILTEDELKAAAQSSQYAHYTSEAVIRSIYKALERFGFPGGRILEPGMGTGHFWGLIPDNMFKGSRYTGIERDIITAKVAQYLYPNQNMLQADYIQQKFPNNFFDLGIGNPPFAKTTILADPAFAKYRFKLHDFFFAKTIEKVRPGGLLVFVTSRYTMDKADNKARKYIADRADLLGAIRLPQTAFKHNAGTEVVTDVLFLRKRANDEVKGGEEWLQLGEVQTKEGPTLVNEYFIKNPEMVLGIHSLQGSMYKNNEYTVIPSEGSNIETQFDNAVTKLPQNIYSIMKANPAEIEKQTVEREFNPTHKKEGGIYLNNKGQLMIVDQGTGVDISAIFPKLSAQNKTWLKDYIELRDALKQAQYDQLNDLDWAKSLKALNKVYDAFVKKNGNINAFTTYERKEEDEGGEVKVRTYRRYKNEKLLKIDAPDKTLVESLEVITDDNKIIKAPFLNGRTIQKPERKEPKTVADAMLFHLADTGKLDIKAIASKMNMTKQDVIESLGDSIYENPAGSWELADKYLSGDVLTKLEEAQEAAKLDTKYKRNIEALLKVQPKPLTPSQITVSPGMSWIDTDYINQFALEELNINNSFEYNKAIGQWQESTSRKLNKWEQRVAKRNSTSEWGTADRSPKELFLAALNNQKIKITFTDADKKTHVDAAQSAQANEIVKKIKSSFSNWIWADGDRTKILLDKYNRTFNNIAPRKYDGSHLVLPGLSLQFKLHPHQLRAIWRIIQEGNTYLAHAVGAGKTLEMIAAGMEMKRMGLIEKPMYVVPKHMLEQFASEFQIAYPMANIMVADEENFHTDNRRRFMAQATLNKPDAIVVTHPSLVKLSMKEENIAMVRDKLITQMKEALKEIESGDAHADKRTVAKIEQRIEQAQQRFAKMTGGKKDQGVKFEDMGVDFMFVDEAHEFRKLDYVSNANIKGIDPNGSMKALDLYTKTKWLSAMRKGRSHVFASGTPITNTMGELYTVMRFFDEDKMEHDNIDHFDQWANMFGEAVIDYELNASGRYEAVERFAKFINVPELMKRVREFMDVLTSNQLGDLVKRPKIIGGKPAIITTKLSENLKKYQDDVLAPRIEVSKKWKPSPDQPGNPDPIINIITDGRLASIDLRFVKDIPNDVDSKLNVMIDHIIDAYHSEKDNTYIDPATKNTAAVKGSTQLVFYNNGFGAGVIERRGFDSKEWVMKRLKEGKVKMSDVAWIDDYPSAIQKEQLFKEMREGTKRILFGSAKKMGTGVNVQRRLKHLQYLDAPWYPSDLEQPMGRILRQGNQNEEVVINWFAAKGSYDATMWQMVARKGKFIEMALEGNDDVRTLDDISEASNYAMASALASGDERLIKMVGLEKDIDRLNNLKAAYQDDQRRLKSKRRDAESNIIFYENQLKKLKEAQKVVGENTVEFSGTVGKQSFNKEQRKEYGEAIKKAYNDKYSSLDTDKSKVYSLNAKIAGFPIESYYNSLGVNIINVVITPEITISLSSGYQGLMGDDISPTGLTTKLLNAVNSISDRIQTIEAGIKEAKMQIESADKRIGVPFEYEQEYSEKIAEHSQIKAELQAEGETNKQKKDKDVADDNKDNSVTLSAGVDPTELYNDIKNIITKITSVPENVQILKSKDMTILEQIASNPVFMGRKHKEYKKLYDRQMQRIEERNDIIHEQLLSPEDTGEMHEYFQLSKKEDDELMAKAIVPSDAENRVMSERELRENGLNEKQIAAYKAWHKTFQKAWARLVEHAEYMLFLPYQQESWNDLLKQVYSGRMDIADARSQVTEEGIEDFNRAAERILPEKENIATLRAQVGRIKFYMPRVRKDSGYEVVVRNAESHVVHREHVNILNKKIVYKRLAKQYTMSDGYTITVAERQSTPEFIYEQLDDLAIEQFMNNVVEKMKSRGNLTQQDAEALRSSIISSVVDELNARGFGSHKISRATDRIITGYQTTNGKQLLLQYNAGMAGYISKGKAAWDFAKILSTIKYKPRLYSEAQSFAKDMLRNSTQWDKLSGVARHIAFIQYIAGRLSMGLIQITQNYIAGIPQLTRYTKGADMKYQKAMKDVATGNYTEAEKRVMDEAYNKGMLQDQFMRSLNNELMTGSERGYQYIVRVLSAPFSKAEEFNRKSAFLVAYRVAKNEKGMTHDKAMKFAKDFVDITHYEMSKANLPRWARGGDFVHAVGKIAYTFVPFFHNYALSIADMIKSPDIKTRTKGLILAKTIIFMLLLGGLEGLPFWDEFMQMLEKRTGIPFRAQIRHILKAIGGETFASLGMAGLPTLLGIDISGSLAMNIPQPFKLYGDYLGNWSKAAELWSKDEKGRAIEKVAPVFASNVMRGIREGTEGARTDKGQVMFDEKGKPIKLTPSQMTARFLGFNPDKIAAMNKDKSSYMNIKSHYDEEHKAILDRWALMERGDEKTRQKNIVLTQKYNESVKEFKGAIPFITDKSIESTLRHRSSPDKKRMLFDIYLEN